MQRTARLVLWRARPPFRKTVAVQRITLGGFLALLRTLAPKVAAATVAAGRGLTDLELIDRCSSAGNVAAFADLVVVGEPAGFLSGWLDGRFGGAFARGNTARLLAATRAAEGDGAWTRYLNTLNRAPAEPSPKGKRARGGGLAADAEMVARLYHVTPWQVEQISLCDFLNLCDTLNMAMENADGESEGYDPTLDPDAEPSPLPKRQVH